MSVCCCCRHKPRCPECEADKAAEGRLLYTLVMAMAILWAVIGTANAVWTITR